MSIIQKNRFLDLPQELINYIYEFARDETDYKKFVKNYDLYYKIYKHIKNGLHQDYFIYLKFEEDDNNYLYSIWTDNRINDKLKMHYKIISNEQLEKETNDYINENIHYIYNDVDDYERCLKDEYYIKNNFKNGMKKKTIKLLNNAIQDEKPEIIYNMLDLETFKHNYFRFNSINDLLNYNYIDDLDDDKIIICYDN